MRVMRMGVIVRMMRVGQMVMVLNTINRTMTVDFMMAMVLMMMMMIGVVVVVMLMRLMAICRMTCRAPFLEMVQDGKKLVRPPMVIGLMAMA
mgnify:CR=1 FL=1